MKNVYILLVIAATTLFASCNNTNDDYDTDRGVTIGFTSLPLEDITLPPGGTLTFPVPFFITDVSSSDRTFNVIVIESETTLAPENYSFETSVTIPAGSRSGVLQFNAENVSMSTEEFQGVSIGFENVPGVNSGSTWLFTGKSN